MLYAGDARWWRHYWQGVERFCGERWTRAQQMADDLTVNFIEALDHDEPGLSRNPRRIHSGGNSGYQAIGLAALWGVERIVLLGFDMQATGGKLHSHANHAAPLDNPHDFETWRARLAVAALDLIEFGIDVVNCSRATALTCFARATLDETLPRDTVTVHGMLGLGDNLYQRPFVRALAVGANVMLRTPWPQLVADIEHVHPYASGTPLRTQARNELQQWRTRPQGTDWRRIEQSLSAKAGVRVSYARQLEVSNVRACMSDCFGLVAGPMDLPPLPASPVTSDRPIALVRPVTVRHEWLNTARNCRPQYVADVARWLHEAGFYIVSVADLVHGEEEAQAPLPICDKAFHKGELDVMQLLALVQASAAVVGPVGWIVPAAIAAHVPLFVLLGGQGAHNAPERLTDPSMPLDLVGWGMPDDFCRCAAMRHECSKGNSRLREQFDAWRLRVAGRQATAVAA